jgi:hypothetical protein
VAVLDCPVACPGHLRVREVLPLWEPAVCCRVEAPQQRRCWRWSAGAGEVVQAVQLYQRARRWGCRFTCGRVSNFFNLMVRCDFRLSFDFPREDYFSCHSLVHFHDYLELGQLI